MNYGTASDDVAESFREALLDLNMNSRYEISNLTVIAKENTEHALAISEALKSHIKQVGQVSLVNHTRISSKTLFITWLNSIYDLFNSFTYNLSDFPGEEAPCFLCPRLHRQERRYSIHAILWPATLHNLHGSIRLGGQQCAEENG